MRHSSHVSGSCGSLQWCASIVQGMIQTGRPVATETLRQYCGDRGDITPSLWYCSYTIHDYEDMEYVGSGDHVRN